MEFNRDINHIFLTFQDNGYECYLVGGAVRDLVIGINPKDYDFATNATPDEIMKLFPKTIPTGMDYGTITVLINNTPYEVTTYRKDFNCDGRRPKAVSFSKTLVEDLKRRDFTMNAMAMDISGSIIDPFNGEIHIKEGKLVFVGNPKERILEDKLRIIRALRFAATLGYQLPYGLEDNFDISSLSKERLRDEFNKIILGKYFKDLISKTSSKKYIFQFIPELKPSDGFEQHNPHHYATVLDHSIDVVSYLEPNLILALSGLFHDIGKPHTFSIDEDGIGHFYGHSPISVEITINIMNRLKYSNEMIKEVTDCIRYHMLDYNINKKSLKKLISKGINLDKVFKLMIADKLSSNSKNSIWQIYPLIDMYHQVIYSKEPFSLKDLAVNGYDLISLGLTGKEIGEELNRLLNMVLAEPDKNVKSYLLSQVLVPSK